MKLCGTYGIRNLHTGGFYYGSSIDLLHRWNEHHSELLRNKHHNKHLQNSWLKHGPGAFVFSVVDLCTQDELLSLEQKLLDRWFGTPKCYNLSCSAKSPRGLICSAETRRKISLAGLGRKQSIASREKTAASHRGKKASPEKLARMALVASNISDATRQRMVDSHLGKPQPPELVAKKSRPVLALDPLTRRVVMRFASGQEAGRNGFDPTHLSLCARGLQRTHKGLVWVFEADFEQGLDPKKNLTTVVE